MSSSLIPIFGFVLLGGGLLFSLTGARHPRWRRGTGLTAAVLGGYLLMGGLFLASSTPQRVQWHQDEDEAIQVARRRQAPLFIDFTADWCEACKVLERTFFTREDVADALGGYVALKVDLTAADEEADEIQQRYGVPGLPTLLLLPPSADPGAGLVLDSAAAELQHPEKLVETLNSFAAGEMEGGRAGRTGFARRVEQSLDGPMWMALLVLFFGGILSSLTPCVYPLIPITLGVMGALEARSRGRAFRLSLTYVAGLALTYSALGLFAAGAGKLFGGLLQHPFVLIGIAALFVLMGLSMVGLFTLSLPASLQSGLSRAGGRGYTGAALMGLVAGLIAAPCLGPVVVVLLAYIASLANATAGVLLMLAYSLGLGLVFLILGTFAGILSSLPRSGPWMEKVKAVFGVVFLVLALWYLKDAVPVLKSIF